MKSRIAALAAFFALSLSQPVLAQDTRPTFTASADVSEGEIKRIDQDRGKLTIKHGELKNLNMPAMTMVFTVSHSATLAKLKVGDKITFVAGNANGQLTATHVAVSH